MTNANVQPGDKVLIHAAAGGVGHLTVQLAKYLKATVIGTSSAKNKAFVLSLGADSHIDYHQYNWQSHGREFDFVLDTLGGEYIDHSLAVTKAGGTLISIPTGLNEEVITKVKAQDVKGYFILVESNGKDMQFIADLMAKGVLKSHVSQTFPFE